ncbi:MAG: hypothetical protein ACK5PZ_21770 [Pirellula sp.]
MAPSKNPKRVIPNKKSSAHASEPSASESEDDSIIGTMFWRSLGVIALVAVGGGVLYSLTRPA